MKSEYVSPAAEGSPDRRRTRRIALLLILAMHLLVYLPIVGHGLHTDDFSRIADNSSLGPGYFTELFLVNKSDGFYRPLNHLSFGLTYAVFGLNPYPYGLFNFLLLACSSWLLFRITEMLFDDSVFSLILVMGWLANVKIISSVLLWAVGRTTGLYVLFILGAVFAVLKLSRRNAVLCLGLSTLFTGLALFSKESAAIAGLLVLAAAFYRQRSSAQAKPVHTLSLTALLCAVYLLYFWLRHQSQAMDFVTTPVYYQPNLSFSALIHNAHSYLSRSLLFSSLLLPLLWWALPGAGHRPVTALRVRIIQLLGWFLGFVILIGPMLLIPFRSNLYVFLPSVFVVGSIVWFWKTTSHWPLGNRLSRRMIILTLVLIIVACPVSWVDGYNSYQFHRHTLDWARTVNLALGENSTHAIVVTYDETQFAGRWLTPMDFIYLEAALGLQGRHVRVRVNPGRMKRSCPVFHLSPADNDLTLGELQPVAP